MVGAVRGCRRACGAFWAPFAYLCFVCCVDWSMVCSV